jgi:serine phosphatase RsbU (regulator of sigma subunit)
MNKEPSMYMKRKHIQSVLLVLAGVFICAIAFAQTPTIDSLRNFLQIHPQEDTIRANTLITLSKAYMIEMNDQKKMEEYNPQLLALSEKIGFKKGMGYAYMNMAFISTGAGDDEKAMGYYFKALKLMEEIGLKGGISSCYQNIGFALNYQGKYAEAIQYTLKGIKIKEELKDDKGAAAGYNTIGIAYTKLGNYLEALKYYFISLKLKEKINDQLGVSVALLNIGNVLSSQGKIDAARMYEGKALTIKKSLGDKQGEAMVYCNIGDLYFAQENYKEALTNELMALKIAEEIADNQLINTTSILIGKTYFAMQEYKEARAFYMRALKSSTELDDKENMISSCNGMGTCYEQQKNYIRALVYYEKALTLSKEIKLKTGIRNAYSNLASAQEKLNNYEKALYYNKLYSEIKDTLLSEESLKQSAELNTRYETDKKEKEILLLTKDQLLKDKTLKEQRLIRIGLTIGLGLFLILSFLLYNRYRFKQKANLILEKQKEEIQQKNVLITDSIDYAKTIQEAILPDDEKLKTFFPDYFILYKPKAIVSGDFYWVGKKDNKIICAVADCTGHGVPGAFMSLLGHNILENVIQRNTSVDPGSILTALNEEIVTRFSKGKERETVKHGMDIAIISIDTVTQELQYAGAKNSLYMVRRNTLTELKADRRSTGIVGKDHEMVQYTNHTETLQKGDLLYMFSDGFPDQKGGPEKKKFFYQPFKDLLVSIHQLPVEKQQQELDTMIINWIGDGEQVDDILVTGIKI